MIFGIKWCKRCVFSHHTLSSHTGSIPVIPKTFAAVRFLISVPSLSGKNQINVFIWKTRGEFLAFAPLVMISTAIIASSSVTP